MPCTLSLGLAGAASHFWRLWRLQLDPNLVCFQALGHEGLCRHLLGWSRCQGIIAWMQTELRDLWRAGLAGATELGARFGPVVRRAGVLLGAAALALLAVRNQWQGDRRTMWAASQGLLW